MASHEAALYRAEAMLVAAIMDMPKNYETCRWISPDLFDSPPTRDIWVALTYILDREHDIGPDELLTKVRVMLIEHQRRPALDRLVELTGVYPAIGSMAPTYAHAVHEEHQHELLQGVALKVSQIVNKPDLPLDEKVAMLQATWDDALPEVTAEAGWRPISGLSTVDDFMAASDDTHEWVVPGLLERQERIMVLAAEKAGKSTLTRQFCLMLAMGVHPLDANTEIAPMRSLLVDLENPAPVARRDFRRQVTQMEDLWESDRGRAFILHKPAGMHLGDPRDRGVLRQAIEKVQPDLLCLSPLYKAYDGLDESWEQQAHGVQRPLDKLREDYNLAIWLEHHSPRGEVGKRELRPFGSTRWARWLDYMVALQGAGEGPPYQSLIWNSVQRDERKLAPARIKRGGYGEPSWLPIWGDDDDGFGFDLALHNSEI